MSCASTPFVMEDRFNLSFSCGVSITSEVINQPTRSPVRCSRVDNTSIPQLGKIKDSTNEKTRRASWAAPPRSNGETIVATADSLVRLRLLQDSSKHSKTSSEKLVTARPPYLWLRQLSGTPVVEKPQALLIVKPAQCITQLIDFYSGVLSLHPVGHSRCKTRLAPSLFTASERRRCACDPWRRPCSAWAHCVAPGPNCSRADITGVEDADSKSYFDTVPQERLMDRMKEKIAAGRALDLVEQMLHAGVMDSAKGWQPIEQGPPQGAVVGAVVSALLSLPVYRRPRRDLA